MCKLFVGANTELWEKTSYSVRIKGLGTSVKLENLFWNVLQEVAQRDSLTVPEMLNRLYDESLEAGHDINNFTSFLRVCAMRYIELQLTGEIPSEKAISIASLDANSILAAEGARWRALADRI